MHTYEFLHASIQFEYTDLKSKVNAQIKTAAKAITLNSKGQPVEVKIDRNCSSVRYYDPFRLRYFKLVSLTIVKERIHVKFEFDIRKPLKKLTKLTLLDRLNILEMLENYLKLSESTK